MKQPAVYIMASKRHSTLYTGVTGNLPIRSYQHRAHVMEGFTARYEYTLLVWYEIHETMESAIIREKQIKAGSRRKKIALIESMNSGWEDLYPHIMGLELYEASHGEAGASGAVDCRAPAGRSQ